MITSDSKLWARALTVTTIAAAGILLSGCSLLGQITDAAGGDDTTGSGHDTAAGTRDDPFGILVGDCINDAPAASSDDTDDDLIYAVDVVTCDVPHQLEAYASIQMTDGDFPGDDAVQEQASTDCVEPFTTYVGLDADTSIYDPTFYSPTEETWNDSVLHDREILCLAESDDSSLITGSVKGINK